MERLTRILLAIGIAKNGVVLVDEIETGFHYSILKSVWEAMFKAACDNDVQLFLTTHDWETVVTAHNVFSENDGWYEQFRYIRLERTEDAEVQAVHYTREELEAAIKSGVELR